MNRTSLLWNMSGEAIDGGKAMNCNADCEIKFQWNSNWLSWNSKPDTAKRGKVWSEAA